MGFGAGLMVGLSIGIIILVLCLFMISSGTINKEEEAYRNGYNDGLNANKNNKEIRNENSF